MWNASRLFAALVLAWGLNPSAQAQQSCTCPQNKICQCVNKGGGLAWTAPTGKAGGTHIPVPAETLVAGLTYALKPDAKKAAYLNTLANRDQLYIQENAGSLKESVVNLQDEHRLYEQVVPAKEVAPPRPTNDRKQDHETEPSGDSQVRGRAKRSLACFHVLKMMLSSLGCQLPGGGRVRLLRWPMASAYLPHFRLNQRKDRMPTSPTCWLAGRPHSHNISNTR